MMADVGADRLDPARNLTPAAGQCPIGEPTRAGPAPLPAAGQVDAVHRMPERGFARNQFLAEPGASAKACVVEQRVGRRQPHRGQPLMSGRTPSERRAGAAPGTGVQHLSCRRAERPPILIFPFARRHCRRAKLFRGIRPTAPSVRWPPHVYSSRGSTRCRSTCACCSSNQCQQSAETSVSERLVGCGATRHTSGGRRGGGPRPARSSPRAP